jgi:quaternary ammonium compound-resistance protein SugE
MAWLYLISAGLFEIGFATSMRFIDSSLKPWPIVAFLIFSVASFSLLLAAMQTIPLGTAYAVWTGIGAAGTVLLGIVYFNEPATTLRVVFLMLLISSIVGLKFVSHS